MIRDRHTPDRSDAADRDPAVGQPAGEDGDRNPEAGPTHSADRLDAAEPPVEAHPLAAVEPLAGTGGDRPDAPGLPPNGADPSGAVPDAAVPDTAVPDTVVPDADEDDDEAGLYEHFAVEVDKGQSPMRLDKYLVLRMEHCSRNRIQAAADCGNILVNDRAAKSSYKVKPFDRIRLVLPYPRHESTVVAEEIPLTIPYEDDDLLLVDKPAGMVVHPGVGNYRGTLVNALLHHLDGTPIAADGVWRAGLVHRIDKNTSGLLVVAKNEHAHAHLARQFFDHTITRRYVALVWGDFDTDSGTIEGNIGRHPRERQQMWVYADGSAGKRAVTHWRVLQRFGYVTLVECRLETGRTHQIRVHMAWQGHPLFGDERYGGDRILRGVSFARYRQFVENCFAAMPRQALHAATLGFVHPSTEQTVAFESPLPEDFRTLVARWEHYAGSVKRDPDAAL